MWLDPSLVPVSDCHVSPCPPRSTHNSPESGIWRWYWMMCLCVPSGRTEVQSVQYGKEKAVKDRVFVR